MGENTYYGADVLQTEQAVLGCAMLTNDAARTICTRMTEADFVRKPHDEIFLAIKALVDAETPVDLLTLHDALLKSDRLDAAGGLDYLVELNNTVPSAANIEHYMSLARRNAQQQRVLWGIDSIMRSGEELLPQLEALVERERQAMQRGARKNDLMDHIESFLDNLTNPKAGKRIKTGLPTLDKLTGGLKKGSISIVGARPGVGKTAIGLNWSLQTLADGLTCLFFSLEMPTEQLLERFAATLTGVNYTKISQLRVTDVAELHRIGEATVNLAAHGRLWVVDDVNCITGIVALIAQVRPDVVYIDYMQIIEPETRYRNDRTREVAEITRALKKAAKQYNCQIIALTQLTRDAKDREPTKADFAESGAQEQQFDVCLLMHRPAFYDKEKDLGGDRAVLIMDKNKFGKCAKVKLNFDGEAQRFTEADNVR